MAEVVNAKQPQWIKPEVTRLGKLSDVAGPSNTGTQGGKS